MTKAKRRQPQPPNEGALGDNPATAGVPESTVAGTFRPDSYSRVRSPSEILPAGIRAPDFTLRVTPDQDLSLSEFHGRPVILAFYPADWSPVCGDQMALYNEVRPEFQRYGAEVIGISVDGAWCHRAFAEHRNIHFPLLADFEPKGGLARSYGVYRYTEGVCERALFVIDNDGMIYWSYRSPIAVNPGADGILEALENLQGRGRASVA